MNNYDKKNMKINENNIEFKNFRNLLFNNPLHKLMVVSEIINITDPPNSKKENTARKGYPK